MTKKKFVNPDALRMWTIRDKCFMCKRKFDKPFLLPVKKPRRGVFQPNFNVEAIWHLSDTHGIPDDISRQWIVANIYDLERTLFGARELGSMFRSES